MPATVQGLEEVTKNLRKVIKETKNATVDGLKKVAFEIKGISMRNTPVDFGNLKASHYVAWKGVSDNSAPGWNDNPSEPRKMSRLKSEHPSIVNSEMGKMKDDEVQVGVTAYYAVYVHENMSAKHTVGKAKFLEDAVQQVIPKAASIVASEAKIDGG
jgi:hypothetical protein